MAYDQLMVPKSLNTNTPTFVQFINNTGRTVFLFWLDYKGDLVRYGKIPPKKAMSMNTYVTHPWIARDAVTWYPLLLNGRSVFYPEAGRDGEIFHEMYRDKVNIHIPVYTLFRRAMEIVYLFFSSEDIAVSDIPKELKDTLAKMSPITDFKNYAQFNNVFYENVAENNVDPNNDHEDDVELHPENIPDAENDLEQNVNGENV